MQRIKRGEQQRNLRSTGIGFIVQEADKAGAGPDFGIEIEIAFQHLAARAPHEAGRRPAGRNAHIPRGRGIRVRLEGVADLCGSRKGPMLPREREDIPPVALGVEQAREVRGAAPLDRFTERLEPGVEDRRRRALGSRAFRVHCGLPPRHGEMPSTGS